MRLFARKSATRAPTLSSLDAYARWAESYPPQAHNALMRAEEAAVLSLLPDLRGQTILDLACGTGRYGLIAGQRGAGQVIAIDNSLPMLRGSSLSQRAQASSEAVPLESASIDGVICGLALGHLPMLGPSLTEMARVLHPGGWAVVSDVHPFIALNGAQRTFSAQGKTFAVEHYPHLFSDYAAAASAAGLVVETVLEPRLLPEDSTGSSAGSSVPVVIVYVLRKPGRGQVATR